MRNAAEYFDQLCARNAPENFDLLREHAELMERLERVVELSPAAMTFARTHEGVMHGASFPVDGEAQNYGTAYGRRTSSENRERRARRLADEKRIPYLAALELAELDEQISELADPRYGAGEPGAPWTDCRPLPSPPNPVSKADYERDLIRSRYAGQGGLDYATWRAAAETGVDAVGRQFAADVQERLDALRARREQRLEAAQATAAAHDADVTAREATRAKIVAALFPPPE